MCSGKSECVIAPNNTTSTLRISSRKLNPSLNFTRSTTVFTNGQNCTKRLSGTGTFESSAAGCTQDGTSGGTTNDIVANGNSETEIAIQVLSADVALGDKIEFRLTRDGGVLLDTYAVVPQLTSRNCPLLVADCVGIKLLSGTSKR